MDIFQQIWNWLCDLLTRAGDWVASVLPDSPFKMLDPAPIKQFVGYIAWFVPVKFVIATLGLWLVAVAGYYLYSVVLRWIKAID